MRILHVITSLYTGGAEKLMVDLLPGLKASGHEVELLLFDGADTPFRRDAEAAGIRIHDIGSGGSVYSPVRMFKLFSYLRRYDVVHTHNTAPQLFAAIGSIFCNVILFTTEHSTSNRRRKWKWYRLVDRWMYNRYRKIICISAIAEKNLREYIGRCKADITTINNGVDVARYAAATPSEELEELAPTSRKIMMVAGFRWEKDQDTLIKALKYLPAHFHLFLVGDGRRRDELRFLIDSEGVSDRVYLMGMRPDVPELLQAADYVVMSSHFEGLSLSSVEGMSVGKPFLASDVDGLREVVGGAGVLFPHQDAEAVADAISHLENTPAEYHLIAERCKARAHDFDLSFMVEKYLDCYKNLN